MSQIASAMLEFGWAKGVGADTALQPMDGAFRQLREECQAHQALFDLQPIDVQRALDDQARKIAEALMQGRRQLSFILPDWVSFEEKWLAVPAEFHRQNVAGLLSRLPAKDMRASVRQRLDQLEQSHHPAVVVSARLIRYAVVRCIVRELLPTGSPINDGEEAARRFYMPQWVAFDDGRMLAPSLQEAEARIAAMQDYVSALHLAVSLAPYIFADEEYQRKRSGMLVQLTNQGRALAHYQVSIIVAKIRRYAEAGDLNRGFGLSLPYFDDQALATKMCDFQVIPAGRTMFIPAFVVLAARREQNRLQQDAHLNESTRMHLLAELKELEQAFGPDRTLANQG